MRRVITAREQYEMRSPWRTAVFPQAAPTQPAGLNVTDSAPPRDRPVMLMYGGAFNPPHQGHVGALQDAHNALADAGYQVGGSIVAPTADKLLAKKGLAPKDHLDLQARANVSRTAFPEQMNGAPVQVSTGPSEEVERGTGKPRRTDLANWAQRQYPDHTIINVTGEDATVPGAPEQHPSLYSGEVGSNHEGFNYLTMPRDSETSMSSSKVRAAEAAGEPIPGMTPESEYAYREELAKHRASLNGLHAASRRHAMPELAPESQLALPDMPRQHSREEYEQHMADVKHTLDTFKDAGRDSRNMYGEYKGDWKNNNGYMSPTRERAAQQRQVLRHFYDTVISKAPREGELSFMAGLGGSGKGQAQSNGSRRKLKDAGHDLDRYATIDKDAIAEYMAENGMMPDIPGLSAMEASPLVHEEASRLSQRLAGIAYREGRNVNWDIVAGKPSSVMSRIDQARKLAPQRYDHKKPSAVLVDADPTTARQGVEDRHFAQEVQALNGRGKINKKTGKPIGGRWVPEEASDSNAAPPGSAHASGPADTFHALNGQGILGNAISINRRELGSPMRSETGMQQPQAEPPQQPQQLEFTGSNEMPTVEDLLLSYEHGEIGFPQLLSAMAIQHISPHQSGGDWGEIYSRAEEYPDPNDYHWIQSAEDCGVLTPEQVEQIEAVIGQS